MDSIDLEHYLQIFRRLVPDIRGLVVQAVDGRLVGSGTGTVSPRLRAWLQSFAERPWGSHSDRQSSVRILHENEVTHLAIIHNTPGNRREPNAPLCALTAGKSDVSGIDSIVKTTAPLVSRLMRELAMQASLATVAEIDARSLPGCDDIRVSRSLADAFDQERLQLFAQPLVPLADPTQPTHYEILVRMVDDEGEIVTPGNFGLRRIVKPETSDVMALGILSTATHQQLLTRLDKWVLTHAVAQLNRYRAALDAHRTVFWINLCGQSIALPEFAEFACDALRDSLLTRGSIAFEISEYAAIGNLPATKRFINLLTDLGCRFALDDFATGLSSLKSLRDLGVSRLKIDGVLIRDVTQSARADSRVRTILQMAANLGLETTADCVETHAVANHVGALGVSFGQGCALGSAAPLKDVLEAIWMRAVNVATAASVGPLRRTRVRAPHVH